MDVFLRPASAAQPPRILRIAVAAGALAVALGLSLLFRPIIAPVPFILFFAAIAIIAAYSGLVLSILSALLSVALSNYFLISADGTFSLERGDLVRGAVFVFVASLISVISDARRRAAMQSYADAERFAVTLASIGDAVIATNAAGKITFLNAVAEGLTGWPRRDASGRDIDEIFRIVEASTRAPAENPVQQVLREGTSAALANNTILLARNGGEHPIDDSSAPIRDRKGKLIGAILVFRTIESRLAAEAELRAAHDQLAVILGNITDGVVAELPNGDLAYANEAAAEITGYTSPQALLESTQDERRARFQLHSEAGEALEAGDLPGQRALGGADHAAQIARYRDPASGEERWVRVQARPVRNAQGKVNLSIIIMNDITEERQAEQERAESLAREQDARAEAETARTRATFLAEAGRILAGSLDYPTTLSAVARLVVPQLADWCAVHVLNERQEIQLLAAAHIDPNKVALAHELYRRYPPSPDTQSGVAAVLHTGESVLLPEISEAMLAASARDPEHLQLILSMSFVSAMIVPLTARGQTLATITFVSTQQGRAYGPADLEFAEALAQRAAKAIDNARLYQQAEQALELRNQFLSIAAHELKTPLTSLLGQVQLLQRRAVRDGFLAPRDMRTLDIINGQVSRLNAMILTLLDTSRLENGQLRIERARFDFAALVERAVEETRAAHDDRTITLECPAAPVVVNGDALRLEQVVQNLLQNALKYSEAPDPVVVTLAAEAQQASLAVRDRGIGIPAEALPNLFQRFYRAENTATQSISGLGVGLYVVKEIVELHGGTVEVQSTEGAGSIFTVLLPCEPAVGE